MHINKTYIETPNSVDILYTLFGNLWSGFIAGLWETHDGDGWTALIKDAE